MAASRTPAATQRNIIWPPRQRFTLRLTWRVLLMRLSTALVVASERWRRGERPSVSTVTVSSSPSRTLAARAGMLLVETAGEVSQQPRRGLDVLTLIGALEGRQYPGPLTLRQMVEDVAGLVDLAALHQRGTTEHRRDRRP